ncbi:efflux transporter outer membrane subunit [Mangrovicoccus sp. HB161399]|uniref:efflux transporter outer membrane subunit n=1 Tax=Mangrovicoccus sp. HB161399 TaxID=2720392 RepID=UPI001551BF8C|nr:efflux transporter outer membrane subunit [Mangrovicoccus sp. HB161399]
MTRPILCLALLAAACAPVGPDYVRPAAVLPAGYAEGDGAAIGEVAARRWWESYGDGMLDGLVERGLTQNLDIAAALERIRGAEAALRATGANAAVSGDANAAWTRSDSEGAAMADTRSGGLSADLVIDLFGGLRRGRQSAAADLEAARADAGTVRLAYLSALVGAYVDARYYQEALALSRQDIQLRRETLAMTEAKVAAGAATRYDQVLARASVNGAEAELPGLEASFLAQVHAIATLLGEPSKPLVAEMQAGRAQPRAHGGIATGIPAELLRNRPDVRSAEQALIAATADIGVAEAELLPSVTLGGTVSQSAVQSWSFGPSLSLPVLSQGRLRANRDQAVSLARQAEIDWRAAILGAVEDVETAHASWTRLRRETALRETAVQSYAEAARLSRGAYEAGDIELSDLIGDDQTLANARQSLAGSVRDLAVQWATVQVALGAGAYPSR